MDKKNKCSTCYGYGMWGIGNQNQPMGPMDASDGEPTGKCPECGANKNDYSKPKEVKNG
jgi:rubredoxin